MRILVVCIGNICRSPLAERLLAARLAPEVAAGRCSVGSAGVGAVDGHAMQSQAAVQLARLGGDPDGFASRRTTTDLVSAHDLVLTATRDVRASVVGVAPAVLHRAFTLRELAALAPVAAELFDGPAGDDVRRRVRTLSSRRATVAAGDLDVPDPMGQDDAVHEAVADLLAATVDPVAAVVRAVLDGRPVEARG
ncbi:low molecular weight phosphatase family protein [Nocardioides alkalitolerans]|uniref:arsenate reductase/protein-tyrosine-phosphatase family protein n=1 Tax=Nocardioides alkalitolerans TaxID=281714 RepID=UPI0004161370|nr:low molecular weight phosphatase family protein [Nocardioides alkalitolerans]